jgi:Ca2+ transporting ATPase
VLARSSPEDKYILATGLKQLGNVVAMTGDGTNDAPALKKADIGFAMGLAGTQVAKEAAGIILLDDNFSSIITAVKYGRNIFDCIRKFLQFQLTVNIVAIFMAFLGAVVIKESPLTPIQMLWVNLIMDTLAALALATEPPSNDLLNRMPYSRSEHIINSQMWRGIVLSSIYQIFVLVIILFRGDQIFGVASSLGLTMDEWNETNGQHLSIFFDVFVFLQVFNFFNARKLKKEELNVFENFFDNYLFIFIVVGIFILQIIIIQIGGKAFMLVPLSMDQHFKCILIGSTMVVYGFIAKKMVPDSFLNNFELLREGEPIPPYDPDNIFERYRNRPATERRESRHRREKEREREREKEARR